MNYAKDWRALSIRQPWAWLIVNGYKDIENRTWKYSPSYRGNVAIHASKIFDGDGYRYVRKEFPEIQLPGIHMTAGMIPRYFKLGGFVGSVWMNDVVTDDTSPWFVGEYGFKMRQASRMNFIEYRGQLGLFRIPVHIVNEFSFLPGND